MVPRRLLASLLGLGVLASCADAIPPRDPAPAAPSKPVTPVYDDVGPGVCRRIDLAGLMAAMGEPGTVEEGRLGSDDTDLARTCSTSVTDSDGTWTGASVQLVISISPYSASADGLSVPDAPEATGEIAPISGWWREGRQAVTEAPSYPPGARYVVADTRVADGNLLVSVYVTNPAVENEPDMVATVGLAEAVLARLRLVLTPRPSS